MTFILTPLKALNYLRLCRIGGCLLLIMVIFCIAVDLGVSFYVRHLVYTDSDKLPYRPYGLVLGTAKFVSKGNLNAYYVGRLEASKELYNKKKVDFLLLSGDNRTIQYNEPRTMWRDLRKMDLPENVLFQDFAGFRTLDSVIRAKEIFQAHSYTIISQKFHCERALFIAKYHNIDAICFATPQPVVSWLTRGREIFARVLSLIDLLIGTKPHFLGQIEPLPSPQPALEKDYSK